MFTDFFYFLRGYGLNVTPDEWLLLCEALDKGLAGASLTGFYNICRATVVKSEVDYDKFDRAFVEYFREIGEMSDRIPEVMQKWLDDPKAKPHNRDEEIAGWNAETPPEEVERMLRERIREQDSEHNGGSYWVGTGGMSLFGNDGGSPYGIRVGGKSHYHRALRVAGERKFRDFTLDRTLGVRDFQVALRYLRQYSNRTDEPKTVLNAEKTADETASQGGMLHLAWERPRRNTVKVLLLMDSGGSMDYYSSLCSALFRAVSRSNRFRDLKTYYFHNCIYQYLYTDPKCLMESAVRTEDILRTLDSSYKLIIVGDAEMAPYELMSRRYIPSPGKSGLEWMREVRDHFDRSVWLNPSGGGGYWEVPESYTTLKNEFDMYELTVENLILAMKKLISSR